MFNPPRLHSILLRQPQETNTGSIVLVGPLLTEPSRLPYEPPRATPPGPATDPTGCCWPCTGLCPFSLRLACGPFAPSFNNFCWSKTSIPDNCLGSLWPFDPLTSSTSPRPPKTPACTDASPTSLYPHGGRAPLGGEHAARTLKRDRARPGAGRAEWQGAPGPSRGGEHRS